MRLAVISDVHGNLLALEAVHKEIKAAAPDVIVNLGDCLSAPLWPEETAQYLMAENWLTVRGNHDRWLSEQTHPHDLDDMLRPELSAATMAWLAALPATAQLGDDILLCHGSPASDEMFLLEEEGEDFLYPSKEAQVRAKLGPCDAALVLCGHSHTPRLVHMDGGPTILNPGSVGVQAFPSFTATGSPHARFAIATRNGSSWSFTQYAIEYDWLAAAAQAEARGQSRWVHGLTTGFAPVPDKP
ncbi:MAG: metallophosphoesterase [Rhizobiaceae bacterium]